MFPVKVDKTKKEKSHYEAMVAHCVATLSSIAVPASRPAREFVEESKRMREGKIGYRKDTSLKSYRFDFSGPHLSQRDDFDFGLCVQVQVAVDLKSIDRRVCSSLGLPRPTAGGTSESAMQRPHAHKCTYCRRPDDEAGRRKEEAPVTSLQEA